MSGKDTHPHIYTQQAFELQAPYSPAGDQITAIDEISGAIDRGERNMTLLGATGTGKTFTMANIIQKTQKATLVLSHNKTLAAQLATEFKHFFPNNAVHYFVSYFDYYQPESYLADKDIYIEKEATINQDIEMYRLSTMASLLTRSDVIVVSSVSALYGLGQRENFLKYMLDLHIGATYSRKDIKSKLITMQYKPVLQKIEPGMFDIRGEMIDIYSSVEKVLYRLIFDGEVLQYIEKRDNLTYEVLDTPNHVVIRPSSQYMQDVSDVSHILEQIQAELETEYNSLISQGKELEANRLKKRTMYDIRMITEAGFVNGIENYSMYFEGRERGDTPNTIFDYFPDDMMVIVDESHMSVPQLRSMPSADRTRKHSLITHGFRLPSASEHRPLSFGELEQMLGRGDTYHGRHSISMTNVSKKKDKKTKKTIDNNKNMQDSLIESQNIGSHKKANPTTIRVSATPSEYELDRSHTVIQQIIRPTGLLDPITYIYPKSGDPSYLMKSIDKILKDKPHLAKFLKGYNNTSIEDIFEDIDSDDL